MGDWIAQMIRTDGIHLIVEPLQVSPSSLTLFYYDCVSQLMFFVHTVFCCSLHVQHTPIMAVVQTILNKKEKDKNHQITSNKFTHSLYCYLDT